jgi:predicted transcriptional regulator
MGYGGAKMKSLKVEIKTESTERFLDRLLARAMAMDRGEMPDPGITISFADPMEMLAMLSAERVRLLNRVKEEPLHLAGLAAELRRDVRAVSRDVSLLEKAGLLRTSYKSNPGHGRLKIVEPVAQEYKLVATL